MTQTQTMQTPDAMQTTDAIQTTTTTTTPDATLSHTTTTTPDATLSHTTMQTMQSVEFDFDNDDDAFYKFIEFGIASNGGRLSIW